MVALSGTPVLSNSGGSTATSMTATLASTAVGDINIIAVSANTTGTGTDPAQSMPAGWTAVPGGSSGKTGTPYHRLSLFYRFFQSGDTNPTVTIAALGNIECAAVAYSGVDTATPFVSGEVLAQPQGASSTSWSTGSITTAALRWIVSVFANRTNGTWSALTDTLRLTGIVASSANIAYEDTNGTVAAGTITARTATFSASTSVGNTVIVALNPAAGTLSGSSAMTSASNLGTSATAALVASSGMLSGSSMSSASGLSGSSAMTSASSLAGTTTATRPASGGMTSASSMAASSPAPITLALQSTVYVAHRGGYSSTLGEGTLEGYRASAAQYSKALLECPVWATSDGVYVISHDQTTGRVFSGTSLTITSSTWASLSGKTTLVGGNPIRRLTDVLDDAQLAGRLFVVDNKQDVNHSTLITLLAAHVPGRWMGKAYHSASSTWLTACQNDGAPVWAFYYPADLGSMSTDLANLSTAKSTIVYGFGDFSAAPVPVQSDSNTFHAFIAANGLKSWAHILGTTTQKSNADTQAATAGRAFDGYMVSGFSAVAPTDGGSSAMTSASSMSGTASTSLLAAAGMVSGSSLTGGASAALQATSAMTSASSLAGSATATRPSSSGMTSGSALTGTTSASLSASAGMTSASSLAGVGALVAAPTATMTSASSLAGATTAVRPAGQGMTSGSSMGQAGAASLPAGAAMASASQLTGSAALAAPVASGMVSGSSLTTAPAAVPASAVMASSSSLGGSAALVGPTAAAMVSASSLAAAAAGAAQATSAMTSASALGMAGTRSQPSATGMVSQSALSGQAAVTIPGAGGMVSGSVFGQVALARLVALASMQSASVLAVMLQPVGVSAGPLSVRLGPSRWACQLGPSRWAVRLGVVDVRASSMELVPVQVKAPVSLGTAQLRFCTSSTDEVPASPDWQPLVVPDGTVWSPGEWVTLLAPVGPGLPVGTLYILPRITTDAEDFIEVAGYRQVRA